MSFVYAHRGASYELPENTLEAFGLALDLGADAIETDAHMTRDGHVVLSHDPTMERVAGVGRVIAEATLAELRSLDLGARFAPRRPGVFDAGHRYRIPTLSEALEAYPNVPFNVEAKQAAPDMLPALFRAVASANASARVRVASFSSRLLERARALGYPGETGLGRREMATIMLAPRFALPFLRVDGQRAQVPTRAFGIRFASQGSIDRMHRLGLGVDFWTINDVTEAKRLFAMGADGVMTDDPRTLCQALGKGGSAGDSGPSQKSS